MRRWIVLTTFMGLLAGVLILTSGLFYYERATVLRVAVSTVDTADYDLMSATASLLKKDGRSIRLHIVPVNTADEAAVAMNSGKADLAIVRSDGTFPDNGEAVVVVHKDAALLLAPHGSSVTGIGDLPGKRIGLVSDRSDDTKTFRATLGQYDIAPDSVTTVALTPATMADALANNSVDVVFGLGPATEGLLPAMVRAVAQAGNGPPVFLPVAEAEAIAQRNPIYDSVSLKKGTFAGLPPRPADDLDTIGVTYRLVADHEVSSSAVAALTRFLMTERFDLAKAAPVARRMEAPATDRGAAVPVHAGAAAYIDDEEESFLDRYSDFIYIGAMVLGVLASGLTALAGRFGAADAVRAEDLVAQLLALFHRVRATNTLVGLDQLDDEVDGIVASALDRRLLRALDQRGVSALTMAVEQVRVCIRERREKIRRDANLPGDGQLVARLERRST